MDTIKSEPDEPVCLSNASGNAKTFLVPATGPEAEEKEKKLPTGLSDTDLDELYGELQELYFQAAKQKRGW